VGTLVAQDIADQVRADLVDEDAVTWTEGDLLEDLNEAMRTIVLVKNDAYTVTEYILLTDGTVQTLPLGGISLVDILENEASKRRTTQVDLELLDETSRFWPAGDESVDVIHYCFDPRDKTQYRVYPPNSGYGSVLASYSRVPESIGYGDVIPLGDQYEPVIKAIMMSLAYRRNTQRQDTVKSDAYLRTAMNMLGLSAQTELAIGPRVSKSPGS
jgi:hypothetical protein